MTRVIIGFVLLVYGVSELLTITGVYDTSWLYHYPGIDYVFSIASCTDGWLGRSFVS